jgi:hypothetical protein
MLVNVPQLSPNQIAASTLAGDHLGRIKEEAQAIIRRVLRAGRRN